MRKRIHFDDARGEGMLPAEGEQLSRQDGGPASRTSDFANVVCDLAFHAELIEKQIAVAENRRKKIVEVVRNARRRVDQTPPSSANG